MAAPPPSPPFAGICCSHTVLLAGPWDPGVMSAAWPGSAVAGRPAERAGGLFGLMPLMLAGLVPAAACLLCAGAAPWQSAPSRLSKAAGQGQPMPGCGLWAQPQFIQQTAEAACPDGRSSLPQLYVGPDKDAAPCCDSSSAAP